MAVNIDSLIFEITSSCPNRCLFCYNPWHTGRCGEGVLTVERVFEVVERIKRDADFGAVALSGGEPLLHPDLEGMVAGLSERGLSVTLITSGAGLDRRRAAALKDAGLSLVQVDIHAADPKLHDALMGREGAYKQATEALANLFAVDVMTYVVCVVTSRNCVDFVGVAELALALGASGLMLNRVNIGGRGVGDWRKILPNPDAFRKALSELHRFAETYNFGVSLSTVVPPCLVDLSDFPKFTHGFCPKDDARAYYTVGPDGMLRVCNHTHVALGNPLVERFKRLRKHKFVREMRRWVAPFCRA